MKEEEVSSHTHEKNGSMSQSLELYVSCIALSSFPYFEVEILI